MQLVGMLPPRVPACRPARHSPGPGRPQGSAATVHIQLPQARPLVATRQSRGGRGGGGHTSDPRGLEWRGRPGQAAAPSTCTATARAAARSAPGSLGRCAWAARPGGGGGSGRGAPTSVSTPESSRPFHRSGVDCRMTAQSRTEAPAFGGVTRLEGQGGTVRARAAEFGGELTATPGWPPKAASVQPVLSPLLEVLSLV